MKSATQLTKDSRIITDPKILSGKPVVKGTRIPVELVLKHLAANPNSKELFAAYPHLRMEDVKACLEYAQNVIEQRVMGATVHSSFGRYEVSA